MNLFLTLAFLFFIGSVIGWVLELFFRRFISTANPERKWINPGFCIGPYLPLYGFGLCFLFLIASLENLHWFQSTFWNRIVLFLIMAVCMTVIEYIAGIFCLKVTKVRLWDYSDEWGNIQGIICPRFSALWAVLGAAYYFLIHPRILGVLFWFSKNLAFSFVIGLFFGVFIIDVVYSSQLIVKLKKFAEENNIIVEYERWKAQIQQEKKVKKSHFFFPFRTEYSVTDLLKMLYETFDEWKRKN